jgi:lysophospholipase L1-like esterase
MQIERHPRCTFFAMTISSPKSRIRLHILVCLLLAISSGGCGKGAKSPTEPSGPPPAGSTVVYTAIGASDVAGIGSSVVCLLNDCPNGTGYVQVAAKQLRSQGFSVTVNNLGIPTAVIGRDFETLGQQYNHTIVGNFIDQEMPFVRQDSTVVTIFAGGNEINTITAALGGGAGASDQAGYIDSQVRAFGTDYTTLLAGIKTRAAAPRIIALNVPNMAGLPFLASASLGQKQAAQRAAVRMSTTVVNALTAQGVIVVDLMCDSRTYVASNYSSDGFHPNDAGYAFIASEVVRAVTSSTYPAPSSSCSQMTIVP